MVCFCCWIHFCQFLTTYLSSLPLYFFVSVGRGRFYNLPSLFHLYQTVWSTVSVFFDIYFNFVIYFFCLINHELKEGVKGLLLLYFSSLWVLSQLCFTCFDEYYSLCKSLINCSLETVSFIFVLFALKPALPDIYVVILTFFLDLFVLYVFVHFLLTLMESNLRDSFYLVAYFSR